MQFSVISSGSRANCTYIEAGSVRLLIDCGLSASAAERALRSLGADPQGLDGVLVTHEHSDHVAGIPVLSKRLKVPVYSNAGAAQHLGRCPAVEIFETGVDFSIREVTISPFSIMHDAEDPVGFIIQAEGLRYVHVTDLGKVTPLVQQAVSQANALVIESNHDEELLLACHYPWVLKQRIASNHGHLSNRCAGALIAEVCHAGLFHVVLGHISENSNTPQVAHATVSSFLTQKRPGNLVCASARRHSPLFRVEEPLPKQL